MVWQYHTSLKKDKYIHIQKSSYMYISRKNKLKLISISLMKEKENLSHILDEIEASKDSLHREKLKILVRLSMQKIKNLYSELV
jgi:hypothetical protein